MSLCFTTDIANCVSFQPFLMLHVYNLNVSLVLNKVIIRLFPQRPWGSLSPIAAANWAKPKPFSGRWWERAVWLSSFRKLDECYEIPWDDQNDPMDRMCRNNGLCSCTATSRIIKHEDYPALNFTNNAQLQTFGLAWYSQKWFRWQAFQDGRLAKNFAKSDVWILKQHISLVVHW